MKGIIKGTLLGIFGGEESKNPLFNNLGKKVLALILAVSLWFVANIEHEIERSISVDINYVNLPSELIVVNNPPQKLHLRVRGPRTQLSTLSPQDIVFTLDLSNVSPGISKFEIQTDQIKTPRGIQVTGISPAQIELDIDRLVRKKVKVTPVIENPPEGFEIVGKPRVIPSTVEIQGPERFVSKLETIPTDLVSTKGVKSTFTIQVPLKPPYPLVKVVGNELVQVTVNIREITVVKRFKDIDIEFVNFDNINFKPLVNEPKAEVEFEGPYSIIKNLNSDDIRVFVDGKTLDKNSLRDTVRLKVSVAYPQNEHLVLKRQKPDTITIKLNTREDGVGTKS
ncbi:hypothetical protein HRbin37_00237 [bacterium HR37]|nr:hypothetical protein HRbin37_00237 [bacterium HR37]